MESDIIFGTSIPVIMPQTATALYSYVMQSALIRQQV